MPALQIFRMLLVIPTILAIGASNCNANENKSANDAKPDLKRLVTAFTDCLAAEAARLDDSHSDASTIADGIIAACNLPEKMLIASLLAMAKPISPGKDEDDMARQDRGWAIQAVLEERRDRRGH